MYVVFNVNVWFVYPQSTRTRSKYPCIPGSNWNCWFSRRGKIRERREKPLGAEQRTNNKLNPHLKPGARFWKLPVITGPVNLFVFHSRGSFERFENCTVKLSAKETKWTSSEVRTQPTFLETLISKSDSGPVKSPGLSRNGPRVRESNPGYTGGRRALSPLRHPCSPGS